MRAVTLAFVLAACSSGSTDPVDAGDSADASVTADAGTAPCLRTSAESPDLPGVKVVFDEQPCVFTLAQAAAGLDFTYAVEVASTRAVRPERFPNSCGVPNASGLVVTPRVTGGGHLYCVCDTGLCPANRAETNLTVGRTPLTFHWSGREWGGPSDTATPEGPAFPAGTYTVQASARGEYGGVMDQDLGQAVGAYEFEVTGTLQITLVP